MCCQSHPAGIAHCSLLFLHLCCDTLCRFFFSSRRRHTRCYRDWSSDVCSSDLWPPPDPVDDLIAFVLLLGAGVDSGRDRHHTGLAPLGPLQHAEETSTVSEHVHHPWRRGVPGHGALSQRRRTFSPSMSCCTVGSIPRSRPPLAGGP